MSFFILHDSASDVPMPELTVGIVSSLQAGKSFVEVFYEIGNIFIPSAPQRIS